MKYLLISLGKIIFAGFCMFPTKKHILLYCYNGKNIEDNILPIYLECIKRNIKVYFVSSKNGNLYENIKTVKQYSLKYFYYAATAKIVITNVGVSPLTVKRKNQIFINTWHGAGGLKGFGNERVNCSFNVFDYFITESKKDEEWFRRKDAWNFKNTFLEIGMPRNDILVRSSYEDIKNVKLNYGISKDVYIVLYAPTWREASSDCFITDFDNIKDILETKYGKKVIVLYKKHHLQYLSSDNLRGVIDCSHGFDIQKLLLIADLLITDYSSCAWDFSLMKKPVALYIPDFNIYIKQRGYSFIDYQSLPYIKAETYSDLLTQIQNIDIDVYKEKINKFHNSMGVFNNEGTALKQLIELCEDILVNN